MNNTWRALINENLVSGHNADLLDAIEDLNPLVLDGGEIPEETRSVGMLAYEALEGWLDDVKDSGLFVKYEFQDLKATVHQAWELTWR